MSKLVILTERVDPPVPSSQFNWVATREGYELGDPIGYGATEYEAITELIDYLEARS